MRNIRYFFILVILLLFSSCNYIKNFENLNFKLFKSSDKEVKKESEKSAPVPVAKQHIEEPKHISLGYIENIKINNDDRYITKAKLDTGAATSSIHAEVIKIIKREEKEYVLYRMDLGEDNTEVFENEIVRWVKIKTKNGEYIKRPVIIMDFCIAGELISEEVNLANRHNFLYSVLVGRNMLEKGKLIVNPSKTFVQDPSCLK